MADELIEQVARAIALDAEDYDGDVLWWQGWVDSAKAAIAAMQPHIAAEREDAARRALEAAATVPPGKTTSNGCETIGQWTRRTLREAIRAIDPAQFREAGNG